MRWEEEVFFSTGDGFFDDLLRGIDTARESILSEWYIFEKGNLADRMIDALLEACARGCRVTLMVDGIGSPNFVEDFAPRLNDTPLLYRVYHPTPWMGFVSLTKRLARWKRLNRRNHRKVVLIDGKVAWIGGMNVTDEHLESVFGDKAWRDNGVRVRGAQLKELKDVLESAFFRGRKRNHLIPGLRLNSTLAARRAFVKDLNDRIRGSHGRVWLITPYFIPKGTLLRAIRRTAATGSDVLLVIPKLTDVPITRWVSMLFFESLLKWKVRVFEYLPSILHAKTFLFDRDAIVGSTNLNHRSFLHDLELDVVVDHSETLRAIEEQFGKDLSRSRELTLESVRNRPWWKRFLGWIFIWFRSVM